MAECTYDFTGPDGKPVRIQGKAKFKAYLANGGLEYLLPGKVLPWGGKQGTMEKYSGPNDVSSRNGQMELANRAGTIAALKGMNAQLRAIDPSEAWADSNIEQSSDLDALRNQISEALVKASRGKQQMNPLRKRLEEASGQELKAVFDVMGLAGARMLHGDRVDALMAEDAKAVSDALDSVMGVDATPNSDEKPAKQMSATGNAGTFDPANPDIRYSFAGQSSQTANAPMSRGRNTEQLHAEDFDAGLRIAQRAFPGVKIIGHASDRAPTVPLSLRQSIKKADAIGDVKGAYHEGAVHIFNNATPDLGTLEFTVAHEATHFGLAGMFGADIDPVMLNINRSNPEIQALAKELQDNYGYSIARSTEEALADMGGDMVKVRGWDKLVSFIRDFLRKHGFVREWTDTDIAALVMRARDYAKNPRATSFYRDNVFSQNLTKGRNVGNVPGMDDAKNVAGKQAPNPAGDVEQGGAIIQNKDDPVGLKQFSKEMLEKYGAPWLPKATSEEGSEYERLRYAHYLAVLASRGENPNEDAEDDSQRLRLYHGSPESRLNEIRDDGKFRGLFMSPNKQNATGLASSSSEQHLHVSEIDQKLVAKHGDLNNLSARKRAVARKVVSDLISKKATPKEVTIVLDAALDDKEFVSDLSADEKEVVTRVTASLDDGDASWEVQMIRGQIAKALGYKAVAMRDEQGTSYLVLPGVDIQPLNEQSTSAGSDVVYSRTSLISPAQRALTRTDAFKEWFGSSKMTAQDGTPLLFMHGSPTSFDAFDAGKLGASSAHTSSGLGHFFTRDAATASKYADGGIVYRGWLKIERPYVMPLKEAQSFKDTKASVARRGELQKQGYDGAVILDDQGKPWATVAFDPWQFKSTENNGNFDEFDDRFRFSRANQGQAGAWPIEPIGKGDRFIYNMQDKQIDTKRVVEAAKKSGVKVTDDINPYLQEELYHGRSAKKFDDFRNKELRPLLDSIRSAGLSLADVESYLWASHAKERNAQIAKINDKMPDGGSGLTNKQADDLLAGRNVTVNGNEIKGVSQSALPALQGIAKQVQAINAATRQMLVDSGMETADTIKAWEGAYSNYVPLHREDIEQGGMGTGMGFSVRGSASKRAIGSGRTVVDILGNIANQRERQIARVEKNRVGQAVLGLAKSAPNEDFWKVDDVPMMKTVEATPVFTAYDKAGNVLGTYSTQLQADRAHPSSGVTIRRTVEDKVKSRMDPTFRSRDEVFHVRVDGKDHFVTFNPQDERALRMATALKNLDADQLGAVLQVTSKATRFFASMATQYNPIWGVVNLTRDVQGALLNLSTTSLRGKEKEVLGHTISALKGIYADLRAHRAGKNPSSKWASLFEEMQDEGGQTGYKDMFGNAKDRTEALERELDPTKWMRSPLGRIFTADGRLKVPMEIAQKRAEGFFGWLSDFNQTTENAIRLASYKTAVDNGMSKQQAASIAKNVSINFNRKGQVATQAGALYAFFNASMQGSARLAETLRGPLGKKIVGGGLALGVMQAMMLSAAGMGDDDPPEFVRERSFIIPTGDGKYIAIPLPLGFHVLPNLSRIPTEYAMSGFKNGGKRIADMFGLVADTFNPIGNAGLSLQTIAPTVIDPLAALAENKDWTGKKIAKEDMSSLHPTPGYLRAKDTASEISKAMSYFFNAASGGTEFKQGMFSPTPDHLDYLIGQIAGGVGREALKIDQTISSAVTGEELPMHKVPLLGRFVGDTKGQSAESGKFYAALTRINEHQAEMKGLRASGRGAEAAEYAKENPEYRLALMATATERALSEDRKLKRKAIAAGNTELVKQIEARSSARMKAFNERLSALEN